MYLPAAFREERVDALHDFIRCHSFATLITAGEQGPFATHLPVLLDASRGPFGTLRAHVAKPNLHWKLFAAGKPTLAVFHGPHAYISPAWYASDEGMVPTWNYVAVHAYGVAKVIDDEMTLRTLLVDTVATYESTRAVPWRIDPTDETPSRLAHGVVGFEIPIDRMEGKSKLSQNRSDADRRGAIDGLRSTGDAESVSVADLMLRALEPPAGS